MQIRFAVLCALLLGACANPEASGTRRTGDRCLYGVEAEYGRIMRWGSCANPPAYSVRIGGPD